MILEKVFEKCQEQYLAIFIWMQRMNVSLGVLVENNTIQTKNIEKIYKRLARIEDKLKIVNVIPLTEKDLEGIKEGD